MFTLAPAPAPASQVPPVPGPRRLPPAPPSHPAARLSGHNSVLSPQISARLSRLTATLTLALGQRSARARLAGILHAICLTPQDGTENSAGSLPLIPHPPRSATPPPSPGGCAREVSRGFQAFCCSALHCRPFPSP